MHSFISSSDSSKRMRETPAFVAFFASCAFVLLVLAAMTEWLIRAHVVPQDVYAAHQRILSDANGSDAAFGDSHAARGFAAADGFTNFAYPSENIEDITAKAMSYFSDRAPGRIILQASPHMFASYRIYAGRQGQATPTAFHLRSSHHRRLALRYWETFLRGGGHMEPKVRVTTSGTQFYEGDLSEQDLRRRVFDARLRAELHHIPASRDVDAAQQDFADLIDWFTSKRADLCIVSFPVSPYYASAASEAGHDPTIAFFEREAERVGALFLDGRMLLRDPSFFHDVDHLNEMGAIQFSKRLMSECFDRVQ